MNEDFNLSDENHVLQNMVRLKEDRERNKEKEILATLSNTPPQHASVPPTQTDASRLSHLSSPAPTEPGFYWCDINFEYESRSVAKVYSSPWQEGELLFKIIGDEDWYFVSDWEKNFSPIESWGERIEVGNG